MRDLHHNISAVSALNPQTVTTSAVNGAIIDTQGYSAVEFIFTSATITDGTHTVSVSEGDAANLSDAAAVTDLLGAAPVFAASDDNVTKRVGVIGTGKRYLRATLTPAGATSGGTFAAIAVLALPASAPVA